MFQNILEIVKIPVTTMIEKSKQEDIKKGAIKALIMSVILALLNVLTQFVSIIKSVSKKSYYYDDYTSSQIWEKRMDKLKDAELFSGFFKQIVIYIIIIAVIAGILLIITKLLKNQKKYEEMLSLVNNTFLLYTIGTILRVIISLIYQPLGMLVMFAIVVYTILTLINAFRDILEDVESDSLVLVSTGVMVAVLVIAVILLMVVYDVSFKDIGTAMELIDYFK